MCRPVNAHQTPDWENHFYEPGFVFCALGHYYVETGRAFIIVCCSIKNSFTGAKWPRPNHEKQPQSWVSTHFWPYCVIWINCWFVSTLSDGLTARVS